MASWGEFERLAPDLARFGRDLWSKIPIAYLATVRKDGSPRVHPFCPIIAGGRLMGAVLASSPKSKDLRRDGRYMIHALPGKDDAEFSIRGRATEIQHRALRGLAVEAARAIAAGLTESAKIGLLFEFDIEQVDTAVWERVGQPDTRAIRRRWKAPAS